MKTAVPGLVIRQTGLSDLHDIYMLGLDAEAFSTINSSWNATELAALFSGDGLLAYTAARKKEIAGFIIGRVADSKAEILWVLVKERFRRKGVGTALINRFKEQLKIDRTTDFFVALSTDLAETEDFFSKNNMVRRESCITFTGKI